MTTSEYILSERDRFLFEKGIQTLKNFSQNEIDALALEFQQLPQIQALFTGIDLANANSGYSDFSFKNVMSQISGGVSTLFNPNVSLLDKAKNLATGGLYGTVSGNKVVNPPVAGSSQMQEIQDLQQNNPVTNSKTDYTTNPPTVPAPKTILGLSVPVFAGISAGVLLLVIFVIWKLAK